MEHQNPFEQHGLPLRKLLSYLAGVLCGLAASVVLLFLLMRTAQGVYWNDTSQFLRTWVDKKMEIARNIPGPRIILLGGSNVFYGLRADEIARAAGRPVFNFGIHGALPLSYYLYRIKEFAKPGDLVLFVPEYGNYFRDSRDVNQVSLRFLFPGDQDFLESKGIGFLLSTMLKTPPDFYLARILYPRSQWASGLETKTRGAALIMGAAGDYELNSKEKRREHQFEQIRNHKPVDEMMLDKSAGEMLSDEMLQIRPFLGTLQSWAQKNNITLLFTWPNTRHFPIYESDDNRAFFEGLEREISSMGIPVLASPYESMLPEEDFFDTINHPTKEAAIARTQRLLEVLLPEIERWKASSPASRKE